MAWQQDHDAQRAAVQTATGLDAREAGRLSSAIKKAVDDLISDDWTIVWDWWGLGHSRSDVSNAFWDCFRDLTDEDLEAFDAMDLDGQARVLGLDAGLVARYPICTLVGVVGTVMDVLTLPDKLDDKTILLLSNAVNGWFGALRTDRRYRLQAVGREDAFDLWLASNLQALTRFGWEVELVRMQAPLARRRMDLLCRVTQDCAHARSGDLLVIENKAGRAYPGAVEQLRRYVADAPAVYAMSGQTVHGLLLADGCDPVTHTALDVAGLHYLPLAALGYRDVVNQLSSLPDLSSRSS